MFAFEVAISLVQGIGLLALIALGYGLVERFAPPSIRAVLTGLVFGVGAVIAMSAPAIASPGIIFDARGIILTTVAAFAGPAPVSIAGVIAAGYRIWLGGAGVPVGLANMVVAIAVGLAWGAATQNGARAGTRAIFALAFVAMLQIFPFLLLPVADPFSLFVHTAPIVAIATLVGISAMGSMICRERWIVEHERSLVTLLMTDAMTRLANRRAWRLLLGTEFTRAGTVASSGLIDGGERSIGLVLFDIDHFKKVNDTFGHHIGDEIIKAVAARIRSAVDPYTMVFRLGGEEFGILVPKGTPDNTFAVAERVRKSIRDLSIEGSEKKFAITVSAGFACGRRNQTTGERLYAEADSALYEAKRQGRNRVIGMGSGRAGVSSGGLAQARLPLLNLEGSLR